MRLFLRVFVRLQFQLQMFDIICSTSWAGRDKCCELPALVRNFPLLSPIRAIIVVTIKLSYGQIGAEEK